MLISQIKAKPGGFKRLDKVIQEFRMKELPEAVNVLLQVCQLSIHL
jgi:hypothetical protein